MKCFRVGVLVITFLLFGSQIVYAGSPADRWYAILPGVTVGTIALGTPEALAKSALSRYGPVSTYSENRICAIQDKSSGVCFQLKDGKVVAAWAVGSPWYVITASGRLPLDSIGPEEALAFLGDYDCTGGPVAAWDDLGLFLVLNDEGIVAAAGVYGTSVCSGEGEGD